jgi:hypothetical protein
VRHSRHLLFGPKTVKLELLLTPLCRLPLTVSDGPVGEAIAVLRDDLKRLKLERIQPNFYLSTGYGTVEGTTNIAVGFYDAHPLIRELHKEYSRWRPSGTKSGTPSVTPTSSTGGKISAKPSTFGGIFSTRIRRPTATSNGPIPGAGITSTPAGTITHRSIPTTISPKPSASGSPLGEAGGKNTGAFRAP